MTLLSLSAHEANERMRQEVSTWPARTEAHRGRLVPVAQPSFSPSFKIARTDMVFTIGSCFARNIEKQLLAEGCRMAISQFDLAAERSDSIAQADTVLNRFVCHTMLNELRWALDPAHPFPEAAYQEIRPGKWVDPHAGGDVAPGPLERVKFRRAAIQKYMTLAAQSDVIVLTLGLAEGWFDAKTGHYMNLAPYRTARTREPDRYQLHLLEYDEITACLEEIRDLLGRFGRPGFRMLVTVSPVPMANSFTGADVMVANGYSKAVQRAALECFVRRHDNVDYFPSYESVTLTDRGLAWLEDQAHPTKEIVHVNVLRMLEAYLENPEGMAEKADAAVQACVMMEHAKAAVHADPAGVMRAMKAAAERAPDDALIRLERGKALLALNLFGEAIQEAAASIQLGSGPYGGYRVLAKALRLNGRWKESYEALAMAREMEPSRPGILLQSAFTAEKLGLLPEALEHMECALQNPAIKTEQREHVMTDYMRLGEAAGQAVRAKAFIDGLAVI